MPNSNKTEGGYLEGLLESKDGKKATVMVGKEKKVFKEDEVCQMNPPVYDCAADMADLTYLGDACVLWNSVVRYKNQLIYTYSGLFCIAINPYKRFPIYTLRTMELYVGKRRNECWPHIFAIAEGAYQVRHKINIYSLASQIFPFSTGDDELRAKSIHPNHR